MTDRNIRKRKKKRRVTRTVLLIEIVCLIVIGFGACKIIGNKLEKAEQQAIAEENRKQAEEEKQRKQQEQQEQLNQWNMILVNPDKAMPEDLQVETAEVEDGYEVDKRICDALKEMLADCREAGYSPRIISSFRTRETQQYLYDHTANKNDTAKPGHSEHECGLAVDIIDSDSLGWADPLIEEQEDMETQIWLMNHCQEYGFILRYPKDKEEITGIIYEPWHYRYVGKEHAETIMNDGICLEEYIDRLSS